MMSLNHRVRSSLMALTNGCPFGPYAMHSAEYLHPELLKPAAFAAAISILSHSVLDSPCTWQPHVALEKPAPENRTLAFLDFFASCEILKRVLFDLVSLCLSICFLTLAWEWNEKSIPRSLVFCFSWYVMPIFRVL